MRGEEQRRLHRSPHRSPDSFDSAASAGGFPRAVEGLAILRKLHAERAAPHVIAVNPFTLPETASLRSGSAVI